MVKTLCHMENRNIKKVVKLKWIVLLQAAANIRRFRKSHV